MRVVLAAMVTVQAAFWGMLGWDVMFGMAAAKRAVNAAAAEPSLYLSLLLHPAWPVAGLGVSAATGKLMWDQTASRVGEAWMDESTRELVVRQHTGFGFKAEARRLKPDTVRVDVAKLHPSAKVIVAASVLDDSVYLTFDANGFTSPAAKQKVLRWLGAPPSLVVSMTSSPQHESTSKGKLPRAA